MRWCSSSSAGRRPGSVRVTHLDQFWHVDRTTVWTARRSGLVLRNDITRGADEAVWFTLGGINIIDRIGPVSSLTEGSRICLVVAITRSVTVARVR